MTTFAKIARGLLILAAAAATVSMILIALLLVWLDGVQFG